MLAFIMWSLILIRDGSPVTLSDLTPLQLKDFRFAEQVCHKKYNGAKVYRYVIDTKAGSVQITCRKKEQPWKY